MTQLIKMRRSLGDLSKHGIEASRATRGTIPDDSPDALLVAEDGRCWLVAIWGGSTLHPTLLDDEEAPSLEQTMRALMSWRESKTFVAGHPAPDLLILAPAMPHAELPGGVWHLEQEEIPVVTQRECKKAATLAQNIHRITATVLSTEAAACWRALAVPETRIESPWKRKSRQRHADTLAAPLLIDYKQERCARLDLEPDPEADQLSRELHLRLITGVAGCGKTLVLVHRAALLATHFPNARVLLVSFNRPLIIDLRRRLERIQAADRVECLTFFEWLRHMVWPTGGMMKEQENLRWIERERQPMNSLKKLSSDWLRDEMRWMCDHALADERYLIAVRKGRGTRLSTRQRREMLALLQRYRQHLRQSGKGDWSEWPLTVREAPPATLASEAFDHLLIDEAQFFAPVWLDLLRSALKPGGHLFLCADPTQGFLKRRESWNGMGFEVRSRSIRLERPYRSTRAILEFARDFYRRRLPEDDEDLNLPASEWLETLEPGVPPIVQSGGPGQDQLRCLEADLRIILDHGTPPGHVFVLVAGRSLCAENVMQHLNVRLGRDTAALAKDDHAPVERINVAHLMAATGLERPVVFLLALDDLYAEETNPLLADEERAEHHHANTRQIYVGITRAMERVVIYASNEKLLAAFCS